MILTQEMTSEQHGPGLGGVLVWDHVLTPFRTCSKVKVGKSTGALPIQYCNYIIVLVVLIKQESSYGSKVLVIVDQYHHHHHHHNHQAPKNYWLLFTLCIWWTCHSTWYHKTSKCSFMFGWFFWMLTIDSNFIMTLCRLSVSQVSGDEAEIKVEMKESAASSCTTIYLYDVVG